MNDLDAFFSDDNTEPRTLESFKMKFPVIHWSLAYSAFETAASKNLLDIVTYLLEQLPGLDQDAFRIIPILIHHADKLSLPVFKLLFSLVEHRLTSMNQRSISSNASCNDGQIDIVEYMLNNDGLDIVMTTDCAINACLYASISIMTLLLKRGYPVNKDSPRTLLYVACLNNKNSIEIIRLLLDHGADPNQKEQDGEFPLIPLCNLEVSATNNDFQLRAIELLVSRGAHLNKTSPKYGSPLTCAITRGNSKLLKYLIEHGAKPTLSGEHYFESSLRVAISKQWYAAMEILLDYDPKCMLMHDYIGSVFNNPPDPRALEIIIRKGSSLKKAVSDKGSILNLAIHHNYHHLHKNLMMRIIEKTTNIGAPELQTLKEEGNDLYQYLLVKSDCKRMRCLKRAWSLAKLLIQSTNSKRKKPNVMFCSQISLLKQVLREILDLRDELLFVKFIEQLKHNPFESSFQFHMFLAKEFRL